MQVVITGGAGFLGRRLVGQLLAGGVLAGPQGAVGPIEKLVVFDAVEPTPPLPADHRLTVVSGDLTEPGILERVIEARTTSVFHFAAVVSAAAEADFDLGMRVNLHGTLAVLEACRRLTHAPRLVFTSSIATFGGELPEVVDDTTPQTPQSSYGIQKAIGELLVNDYTRKGFIDGRAIRLPTIVVRPGTPNRAASTFASSIIREPLSGLETMCPVRRDTRLAILSPRRAIDAVLRAHNLPGDAWGRRRALNVPGLSVTVADMVEALQRVAGDGPLQYIRWEPDADIQQIISGWPGVFTSTRAQQLGFEADVRMDDIVQGFIEDYLPSTSGT